MVVVADTGVTEDVDGELSSHTKSEEEADNTEGGLAATLVVTLFLLILTELALETAKFRSSQFFANCESVSFCSTSLVSHGFVAIHPSK